MTVWLGKSTYYTIVWTLLFQDSESGDAVTVNKERYLDMIKEAFDEETMLELHEHWYMQDGAPEHSSKVVIDWLEANFPQRLISIKSSFPWPANSPDLNPLD